MFTCYDTVHTHFDAVHSMLTPYDTVHTHLDKVHTRFGTVFILFTPMTQFTHILT